jgi:hypothetical protein
LAYTDAYTDLLWEKNTVRWLKNNRSEQGIDFLFKEWFDHLGLAKGG